MIYIDIGNSYIKIAMFKSGTWEVMLRSPLEKADDALFLLKLQAEQGSRFMASSVVSSLRNRFEKELGESIRFVRVSDFPTDLIDYHTRETLGVDRVIACLGARHQSDNNAVIVVDAGTATTIDFMDMNGVFHGGVIAPGLQAMEQGLREHAPALPTVERVRPAIWPPKSTTEALQWGLTGSYQSLVRDHIQRFLQDAPDAWLWVSGGDAGTLMNLGGLNIHYHPNLVFEGLRFIAELG